MGFSQRMGLKPLTKEIQIESIDDDLRNGLWNLLKMHILDVIPQQKYGSKSSEFQIFCSYIWHNYYKLPIDRIPYDNYDCESYIRETFFGYSWDEVYDFIEFNLNLEIENCEIESYIDELNELLIREFSGYRVIERIICPITNEIEIEEIRVAINQYTASEGANIHLSNALAKLSDKKNPDYANSIKESISALGSFIRLLTGESTFGKGLNKLSSKGIIIDEQIKGSVEKIYNYTNNKNGGIRHEIVEDHKSPDFDEAKLMLVLCSSYINFLISKSKK